MKLIPEVKKRINPYMKATGFRIRNRTYYFIQNDIAYCITFEQPTGLLYTWLHVIPLYVPSDSLTFTYGNRLNHISDVMLPQLGNGVDSTGIDQWCELFLHYLESVILPFFRQIDTPKKLAVYVEQPRREITTEKICCPTIWIERLMMYTYVYLHDFSKAECYIASYKNEVFNCDFLSTVLQGEKLAEAEDIQKVVSAGEKTVSIFFEQIINRSLALFK